MKLRKMVLRHIGLIKKENLQMKYIKQQQKAVYPNAYEPWTENDDTKLVTLYKEGKSVNELTNIFLRNSGAIKARLLKLLGIDLDK